MQPFRWRPFIARLHAFSKRRNSRVKKAFDSGRLGASSAAHAYRTAQERLGGRKHTQGLYLPAEGANAFGTAWTLVGDLCYESLAAL